MKKKKNFLVENAGLFLGLILAGVVFYFDYITVAYLGLSLFYIGVVAFSTWKGGLRPGLIVAFTSAVCWLAADLASGINYPSIFFPLWNAGIRLFIFVIIAYFIWKIETAKKIRKDFFNFVVHDLRNPLSAILLVAENMKNDPAYAVEDGFKAQVDAIVLSGKQMTALIEAILDLSRLESKMVALKFSDVDIKGLVQSAQRQVAVFADTEKINLQVQIEPGVSNITTDPGIIFRVLINLLVNAIKVSPRAGAVTVRVKAADKGSLAFSVIDQGPGIPGDMVAILFKQFVSTKANESGVRRGFGLGLNFCKLAVEKLGGRIYLSENQENGAVFTFILPLKPKCSAK